MMMNEIAQDLMAVQAIKLAKLEQAAAKVELVEWGGPGKGLLPSAATTALTAQKVKADV